jgi:hypothetical protein
MKNITIEQIGDGIYRIHSTYCGDSIAVTAEEAFELLSWLYDRKDTLYQSVQHPDEEERLHLRMQQGMLARTASLDPPKEQLTKIAKHVAWAVVDTEQAMQCIDEANSDPHEKRRRTDNAMVAMLEVVAPVLPEPVQVEVKHLIALHDEAWRDPEAFVTTLNGKDD